MDAFRISGGRPLHGTTRINGSKNAALPLMAAALLTEDPVTLRGTPNLSDIRNMIRLLDALGLGVDHATEGDEAGTLRLTTRDAGLTLAHYDIVRTMRAGICVLGPLLARRGAARVSMPGGCASGGGPVDLHLRGLRALGAEIQLDAGYIVATAPGHTGRNPGRLRGAHVFLGGPMGSSVLGTANVLSAAVLAEGTTLIESAACEPEIVDLGRMLITMGARIEGLGSPCITVQGVDQLGGVTHDVIPDRIEAGTYLCAAAITSGRVTLENFPVAMLTAALDRLRQIGVEIEPDFGRNTGPGQSDRHPTVTVQPARRFDPTEIVTQPHPGFPTDLQAQFMALLCLADGNSTITEKIYPDRFLHVAELTRMGAEIQRLGPTAVIRGVRELVGAPVMASDLRASAGLVLAGLAARGTTLINRVYHLDRGYDRMERTLQSLGADIERFDA